MFYSFTVGLISVISNRDLMSFSLKAILGFCDVFYDGQEFELKISKWPRFFFLNFLWMFRTSIFEVFHFFTKRISRFWDIPVFKTHHG